MACTSCFWRQGILATKIYLIRYRLFFVNQSKNKQALHVHVKLCEELHVLKTLFNSVARISSKFTSKALSNSFKIRSLQNSHHQGQRLDSECVKKKHWLKPNDQNNNFARVHHTFWYISWLSTAHKTINAPFSVERKFSV